MKELDEIKAHLEKILRILTDSSVEDSWIRKIYAEYLVAFELASRGHEVQIGTERDVRSADVYLPDLRKRVEVKSGIYERDEYGMETAASFGNGGQIKKNKFDYCVFVAFDKNKIDRIFMFRSEELKEVARPRPQIAAHKETNPCLLLFYKEHEDYKHFAGDHQKEKLQIEDDLNKNPRKYQDRWSIIG